MLILAPNKISPWQGNRSAKNNLGILYENGLGVGKNLETAIDWYTQAANQGHQDAKKRLEALQSATK